MNRYGLLRNRCSQHVPTLCIVVLFFVLFTSCHKSGPTEPQPGPDTTSHEFIWDRPALLGEGAGGLSDVTIVNDTLAYAAGGAYKLDSTGILDPKAYNLFKWDGKTWSLNRLQFYSICGQSNMSPFLTTSVISFGPSDTWFAAGNQIVRWNGSSQSAPVCLPTTYGLIKMWAASSNLIYAVGGGGTILRYDGNTWQSLYSGTTLDIRDIWGALDPVTGKWQVLAVASGNSPAEGKKLLAIDGTPVAALPDSGLSWILRGIYFVVRQAYYVAGDGLAHRRDFYNTPWNVYPPGTVVSYQDGGVRGNGVNDVFVVGSFMECVHYNGSTWHNYKDQISFANGALVSICVKGNLVIAVGLIGQQGVAVVGRRRTD